MKFPYRLLLVISLLIGSFVSLGGTNEPETVVAQDASAERPIDERGNRGAPRSESEVPPSTTTSTSTSTTTTSTSTTAPSTTTTTIKKVVPKTTTTIKKTAPTPPVTTKQSSDGRRWMNLISQYNWDTEHAYRIMMCESGGNPNAVNRSSGATGLFQIYPGGTKYKDPAANVAAAYSKYQARGWKPWVCRG